MNLNNTKLDLSEYSEEERKEIVEAYAEACGNVDCPTVAWSVFIGYRANSKDIQYYLDLNAFKNGLFTEVTPVLNETWEPINSIDDLKVGDTLSFTGQDFEDKVVYVGNDLAVVKNNDNQSEYVITGDLSSFRKKIVTWCFEPKVDDSFAKECFDVYWCNDEKHTYQHWDSMDDTVKSQWREVAKLKLGK